VRGTGEAGLWDWPAGETPEASTNPMRRESLR
jgi:hypothetical protein